MPRQIGAHLELHPRIRRKELVKRKEWLKRGASATETTPLSPVGASTPACRLRIDPVRRLENISVLQPKRNVAHAALPGMVLVLHVQGTSISI